MWYRGVPGTGMRDRGVVPGVSGTRIINRAVVPRGTGMSNRGVVPGGTGNRIGEPKCVTRYQVEELRWYRVPGLGTERN